jgi:hypothetical protein
MSLVIGAAFFLLYINGLSQAPSTRNLQEFSGRWEGTMTMSQKGACKLSGGPNPYAVVLTVSDDGSFFGESIFMAGAKKGEKDPSRTWVGEILPDLHVRLAAQNKAKCKGEESVYNAIYTGQFFEKNGKYRLNLKGSDKVCTQMQCVFESTLELQQK